jgi:hypothetical protein
MTIWLGKSNSAAGTPFAYRPLISPDLERTGGSKCLKNMAGTTRLELATSAVTGQRSNQLNYVPALGTASRQYTSAQKGAELSAGKGGKRGQLGC